MLHVWCHLCQNMAEHLLRYMFNETHMMDVIGLNCTVWMAGGSKIFRLKSTGRHIALINLKKKKKLQFWDIWDLLPWPDSMLVFKVLVAMACVLHERHHKKMEEGYWKETRGEEIRKLNSMRETWAGLAVFSSVSCHLFSFKTNPCCRL